MVSQEKIDEIVQDALDEERLTRIEEQTEADECPGAGLDSDGNEEHCGNDCGGYYDPESGDHEEPVDCVHCLCCGCTPCSYARVG